jgi:ATP-dependent RNA helicase DDX3X
LIATELFDQGHILAGINFDKYDDIPVEATGNDVPEAVAELGKLDINEVIRNNCALMG